MSKLTRTDVVLLALDFDSNLKSIKFHHGGWMVSNTADVYVIVDREKLARYLEAHLPNAKAVRILDDKWAVASKNVFAYANGDPWLGLRGDSEEIEFRD